MTAAIATPPRLTSAEALIRAALGLPPKWRPELLTIAAWRLCPKTFGMRGMHKIYPNHNRVLISLYRKNNCHTGLIREGIVRRVAQGWYEVDRSHPRVAREIERMEIERNGGGT